MLNVPSVALRYGGQAMFPTACAKGLLRGQLSATRHPLAAP